MGERAILRKLAVLTRVEHTLFALPFALASMLYAAGGLPELRTLLLALLALVAGRSLGMACNRLVDRRVDAENPRTENRLLPRAEIGVAEVGLFAATCALLLGLAAWALNPLCLRLLPVALGILVGYSYAKFYTSACHLVLGLTHGTAIGGSWLAVTGQVELPVWFLSAGVTFWTTGFDIIYSCQDIEVDRRLGLHSIPARLGRAAALDVAALSHGLSLALLLGFGAAYGCTRGYYVGLALVTVLLAVEHAWARRQGDEALQQTFFQLNVAVSLVYLVTALIQAPGGRA